MFSVGLQACNSKNWKGSKVDVTAANCKATDCFITAASIQCQASEIWSQIFFEGVSQKGSKVLKENWTFLHCYIFGVVGGVSNSVMLLLKSPKILCFTGKINTLALERLIRHQLLKVQTRYPNIFACSFRSQYHWPQYILSVTKIGKKVIMQSTGWKILFTSDLLNIQLILVACFNIINHKLCA